MNDLGTHEKTPGFIALEGGTRPVPTGPSDTELLDLVPRMPLAGPSHESVALARKAMEQAPKGYQDMVAAVARIHSDYKRTPMQMEIDSAMEAERIAQKHRDALAAAWAGLTDARVNLSADDAHDADHMQRIDQSIALVERMDKLLVAKVKQYHDRIEYTRELEALRGEV